MLLNPFFSIIIPTLNAEKTIQSCLESLQQQVFKDFEVLIIDNLSTDETIHIARSLNDDRIKILSSRDKGIYDAMNKGITIATGRWLYFLGSDDQLQNNHVLQKIALISQAQNAKVIYGNVIMNDTKAIYCGKVNDVEILYKNICHQAIFYDRQIFENQSFSLTFKVYADYDFNLKLFQHQYKYIYYTDMIIANYSNMGFSSTNTENFDEKLDTIRNDFLTTKNWLFRLRFRIYNLQLNLKPSPIRGVLFKVFKGLSS